MSFKINLPNPLSSVEHAIQNTESTVQKAATSVVNTVKTDATNAVNTVKTDATQLGDSFSKGVANAAKLSGPAAVALNGNGDVKYDGLFVGADGKTYPPSTRPQDVPAVLPNNGKAPSNQTVIYVNGIHDNKAVQSDTMQAIANTTGDRVIGIHNATQGIAADLLQCVEDKLDKGKNPAVDTLADTVYSQLKAGNTVHIMGHSQGGLITSRALWHVQRRLELEDGMSPAQAQKLMGNVQVETFGAASGHYPDGPQYVHYINRADVVPELAGLGPFAPWDPTKDAGKGAVVHYFDDFSLNPVKNHSISTTYMEHWVPFNQARQDNFGNK